VGRTKEEVPDDGVTEVDEHEEDAEVQEVAHRGRHRACHEAHARLEVERLEDPEHEAHQPDARAHRVRGLRAAARSAAR
jgi:hypothetical protein